MQEYSVATRLGHTIVTIATGQGALGVGAAQGRLGDFSGLSTESLRDYFTRAARGTRVEGALLKVHSPNNDTDDGDDYYNYTNALSQGVVLESVELRLELRASL